jgi:inositol oxygenase
METHNSENHIKYRDYTVELYKNQKMEIIHNTYKHQRQNINYKFNSYLIDKYCKFNNKSSFWALFSLLDKITDLSDPDTSLPNSVHALQTAEAIRNSDKTYADWMPLVGLIHDMGKILYVNGSNVDGTSSTTQWSIVGDTFITGCPIPNSIVLPEYNSLNIDHCSGVNMYSPGCGLYNTNVSFGHDEYMYRMLVANKHKMPKQAEYIVRYHSLYAWHSGKEYDYLENEEDKKMKHIVKDFSKFDLYTKNDELPIKWNTELKDLYSSLVKKYIAPDMIVRW